jgi:hypothetical protein
MRCIALAQLVLLDIINDTPSKPVDPLLVVREPYKWVNMALMYSRQSSTRWVC